MSQQSSSRERSMYVRFAAMIATSTTVMLVLTYGPATTEAEAESRRVPEFDASAD